MNEIRRYQTLDALVEDFKSRLRNDPTLTTRDFASDHPEMADSIVKFFPAIESLERMRNLALIPPTSQSKASMEIMDRRQLGDFRILKEIGRGGMGVVYLAEQISLGRHIALKVLPPSFAGRNKHMKRFEREARIAANLHHTNIVPVFGVGKDADTLYIALQYIDGVGLDRIIATAQARNCSSICGLEVQVPGTENTLDIVKVDLDKDLSRCVAKIGVQAARALQFAHEKGVLHRDVTPSNLLIDTSGKIWVTDFGLASAQNHDELTDTGAVMGTIKYMAPEQYCRDVDARSDIFSLGLCLFELAALSPARNAKEFFRSVAENRKPKPRKSLRHFNPTIHRDLDFIISKMIESNPKLRYETSSELVMDLECFLNGDPLKSKRPTTIERWSKWCRQNPLPAITSIFSISLLLLVTGMSTFGYLREIKHRERMEILTAITTDALSEIYAELAPRNLPQDLPAIRSGRSPVSSFDVVAMPSDETLAVLEKLQRHYERVCEFSYDAAVMLQAADAKNRIGQINIHLGKLAAAELAFTDSAKICDQILSKRNRRDETVVDDARILLASTKNQLGYVFRGQFNDALAKNAHDTAFEILKQPSVRLRERTGYQFELARTLYSQDVYTKPDDTGSDSRIRRALGILNRLALPGDPEIQLLRARCYRRLSEKSQKLPNQNDKQALTIMRQLVQRSPEIAQYRFELGYILVGDQFTEVENADDYFQRISEAISIARLLVDQFPDVPSYVQLNVLANEKLANFWQANLNPAKAAIYSQTAIALQQRLLDRFPQLVPQNRVFLYALRLEATEWLIEQERHAEALDELTNISLAVEKLVENPRLSRDWHALRLLTAAFDSQSRLFEQIGQSEDAAVVRRKADHYRKRFFELSN